MGESGAGKFGHFTPYGAVDVNQYLKRFSSYLFTRGVVEPDPPAAGATAQEKAEYEADKTKYLNQRKRWLLAEIGPEAYAVLDGLCGAGAPEDKTCAELETMLTTHFRPARNKNTEREKFHARRQESNESVSQFSVALYQLSKFCDFGAFLDQALQTQFINNLKSRKVKEKVAEGRETFSMVVTDAAKFEQMFGADSPASGNTLLHVNKKQNNQSKGKKNSSQKPTQSNKPQQQKKTEGKKKQGFDISKARCYNCNQYANHLAKDCPQPKTKKEVKAVQVLEVNSNNESDLLLDLYPVSKQAARSVFITVHLNGIPVNMELDTGAKASTIDQTVYMRHFSHVKLRPTATLVWGEPLPMLGEMDVNVEYNGQKKRLTLSVVGRSFPALYGLPWIRKLRPNFDHLFPEEQPVYPVSTEMDTSLLVTDLKQKFPTVFSGGTEPIKNFEVNLVLKCGTQPVFRGPRVVSIPLREPTRKALQVMEQAKFIEKCEPGPWGTPIVPVKKKNGEVRVCGDFSVTLNPNLEVTGRALPLIDDLSTVDGAVFCILDMKMAYLQLRLAPASQEMCKLNTPFGSFKCLRMPFGIASAPTAFQEVISTILADIPNVFIYLDDILIWGKTKQECLRVLYQVLTQMEKYHVKLNLSKSKFLQPSVVYLGFLLDHRGSSPDPARMDELLKKDRPRDAGQLKSFLGMITFFHKYGEHLATVLHPLYQLKQANTFYWEKREQSAYDLALELLSTTVLVPYSLNRPLRLTTDASPVGAGCVLSHVNVDGTEEPVAFASKMFSDRELKYPVHEREGLALIFGIKKFHKYLSGRTFEIVTDNKPLAAIFGAKNQARPMAAARLQRWALLLSAYQYTIVHRRSVQIPHADYLSRFPCANNEPVESEVYWVSDIPSDLISATEVAQATLKDPVLSKVLCYVMEGWPEMVSEELKPYQTKFLELSAESNCVLWNNRVIIPKILQNRILELLHDAHPGGSRMKSLARSYVWWPGMDQEIENVSRDCGVCKALQAATPHESYVPWTWPTRRWQRLHMDFGTFKGVELLIILDAHSRWLECKITVDKKASTVIEVLRCLFAAYGLPEELVSDNGQPFSSQELAQFLTANGVVQTFAPTYHAPSNGSAEKMVQTAKNALKKQLLDPKTEPRSMQHKLDAFLFQYRNTPHSVTKVSPAELFLGRRPRTPLSILQPSQILKKRMAEVAKRRQNEQTASISVYKPGDLVWVQNLTHRKMVWVPGIIQAVVSSVSYEVLSRDHKRQVSSSHLMPRSPTATVIEEDPIYQKLFKPPEVKSDSSVQLEVPLPMVTPTTEPASVDSIPESPPVESLEEDQGIPEMPTQASPRKSSPATSPKPSPKPAPPPTPTVTRSGRLVKQPKKFESFAMS